MDAGAVAALRELAAMVDSATHDSARGVVEETTPAPRQVKGMGGSDNVFVSYLKFCESLGLTPAGRNKLTDLDTGPMSSKVAQLRAVRAGGK